MTLFPSHRYSKNETLETFSSSSLFVSKSKGSSRLSTGSFDSPFITINEAISVANGGDTIIVLDGDTYREDCDLQEKSITLKSFSTVSPLPQITTADLLRPQDFTLHSSNVYTSELQHSLTKTTSIPMVLEDDEALTYVSDIVTCESTPGSYTYTGFTNNVAESPGSFTLYIHPSNSEDLFTNKKIYECTVRDFSVHNGGNGTHVDGFVMYPASNESGSLFIRATNVRVRNCIFKHGHRHFAQIAEGSFERCICTKDWPVEDSRITGRTPFVIFRPFDTPNAEARYSECIVDSPVTEGSCFFCHTSASVNPFKRMVVEDCYSINAPGTIVQANDCLELYVYDTYIDGFKEMIFTDTLVNIIDGITAKNGVNDCFIYRNFNNGAELPQTESSNILVTNVSAANRGLFWGRGTHTLRNVTVDIEVPVIAYDSPFIIATHDIQDSILVSSDNIYNVVDSGDFITADNNIFWDFSDSTPSVLIDNNQYSGLSNWNSLGKTLLDDNSYEENPNFTGTLSDGDLTRSTGTGLNTLGSLKSITPPNITNLRLAWEDRILEFPRSSVGASQILYFN